MIERGMALEENGFISLTEQGFAFVARRPFEDGLDEHPAKIFARVASFKRKTTLSTRTRIFLWFYDQGYTYQQIGDLHNLTREGVRFVLNQHPEFVHSLRRSKESKRRFIQERESEKIERCKAHERANTVAALFPEQVELYWDKIKNKGLNPANVLASRRNLEIWLRCPVCDYSWSKTPGYICQLWRTYGGSGCPSCAGKLGETPERQLILADIYPEMVELYWDKEKNDLAGIDPCRVTLGSNQRAHL